MRSKTLFPPSLGPAFGLLTAGLLATACSFNPSGYPNPDSLLPFGDDTVVVDPISAERNLVYETPGVIAVYHGETCAKSDRSGQELRVRVQEQLPISRELDRGTVIANGYRLRYLSEDHHVKGLGTAIARIEIGPGVLKWEAAGVISDNDFNDSYEWCYTFTAVAWNSRQLLAEVDHGDTGHAFRDQAWTHGTALQPVPGYLYNKAFAGLEEVAVLPRGFGSIWAGDEDRHLLQLAYKNDGGEVSVEGGKTYGNGTVASPTSSVGTGFVTWESTGFIKENDLEHSQMFAELVTGLGGRDVGIISQPFTVTPREDSGAFSGCNSLGAEVQTVENVVESVPFQFAIPVLSGWDLAYICDDEHVTEIGAWLPKWEWQPSTSSTGGTLRYTVSSILHDKDFMPSFHTRTQVKILGFRPLNVMKKSARLPRP